jgi:hypothetical protein
VNIEHVSLLEVIAAARGRYASLVPESAGHLMLGIGRATAGLPVRIHASEVLLSTEGAVALVGRKQSMPMDQACRQLSLLFKGLLEVATGHVPALANAARRSDPCDDVGQLYAIVTQALIPLNRGAAKRALARLARETTRAKQQGLLALKGLAGELEEPAATVSDDPCDEAPEIIIVDEQEIQLVDGLELIEEPAASDVGQHAAQHAAQHTEGNAARAPESPKLVPPPLRRPDAALSSSNAEAASPCRASDDAAEQHVSEPTPTFIDAELRTQHVVHRDPPDDGGDDDGADDDVLAKPGAMPSGQPAASTTATPDAGGCAAPAAQAAAPPTPPCVDDPIAMPTQTTPSRLDELLDVFGGADDEFEVSTAARGLKRLAQLEPTPLASQVYDLTPSTPLYEDPSIPSLRISGIPQQMDDDSGAIAPQIVLSERLLASRMPIALGAGLVCAAVAVGALLSRGGDDAASRPVTADVASPTATKVTGCHADLALRDLPSPHEILLKLGTAPFESRAIPTNVRLELVATAPGHQAERIVIPPDADWKLVDGRRIMPLRLALGRGDDTRWPSAPAARVGGTGPKGYLSVTSQVPGAELWLVAGAGSGTRNAVVLRCDREAELLVINPARPSMRKRVRIEPPLLRAAAETKAGAIPVMP